MSLRVFFHAPLQLKFHKLDEWFAYEILNLTINYMYELLYGYLSKMKTTEIIFRRQRTIHFSQGTLKEK